MDYEKLQTENYSDEKEAKENNAQSRPIIGGICGPRDGFTVIIIVSVIFAMGVTVGLIVDILYGKHQIGHAAVSSQNDICSEMGLELMKEGGSAVDAAICTSLCVGVTNPEASGIGGGGFMVIEGSDGTQEAIDFRTVAPAAAEKNMFSQNHSLSLVGGLAVAVPGQLKGFEMAHSRHGRLPWSRILEPVIALANSGFRVNSQTETKLSMVSGQIIQVPKSKLARIYVPDGKPVKAGSWINRPDLAKTLKLVKDFGTSGFYEGSVADNIIETVRRYGGIITAEDLTGYKPILKRIIHTDFKGYRILTSPAPSGGPLVILALNILKSLNITSHDGDKPLTYHYMTEAFKYTFASRGGLGDPGFVDIRNTTKKMLSQSFVDTIIKNISSSKTFPPSHYNPKFDLSQDHGTSQVSVIGPRGNIASVTNSINARFGSMIMTDSGILLNNDMNDFSIPGVDNYFGIQPSKANYIKGGKRPLSSMSPVIVLNKHRPCEEQISMGGAGGSRIPTGVVQTLLNYIMFGNTFSSSINKGRIHHQLLPDILELEGNRFPSSEKDLLISTLKSFGHKIEDNSLKTSTLSGVVKLKKQLFSYVDSRIDAKGGYTY